MTDFDPTDEQLDALFAGAVPPDDPDLGELRVAIGAIRSLSTTPGDAWVRQQMTAVAAASLHPNVVPLPTSGRHPRRMKIAAAAAAATFVAAATVGLAAADTLPRPVQAVVARALGTVGVQVPGNEADGANNDGRHGDGSNDDHHDEAPTSSVAPPSSEAPPSSGVTEPTTEPQTDPTGVDHPNNGDGTGDGGDQGDKGGGGDGGQETPDPTQPGGPPTTEQGNHGRGGGSGGGDHTGGDRTGGDRTGGDRTGGDRTGGGKGN